MPHTRKRSPELGPSNGGARVVAGTGRPANQHHTEHEATPPVQRKPLPLKKGAELVGVCVNHPATMGSTRGPAYHTKVRDEPLDLEQQAARSRQSHEATKCSMHTI